MPVQTSYLNEGLPATPVELLQGENTENPQHLSKEDGAALSYVLGWRNRLRTYRIEKINVWNECWSMYRGKEDFSMKEDWQSKIVLPKAWGTVKQATSVIKRLLNTPQRPWTVEPTNPADPIGQIRGEKQTDLTRVMLDKARFLEEFSVGLETGFIMGLGILKVGWYMAPRKRYRVITQMIPVQGNPTQVSPYGMPGQVPQGASQQFLPEQPPAERGVLQPLGQMPTEFLQQQNVQYPTQLPQENLLPPGALEAAAQQQQMQQQPMMIPQKQVVEEEVMEGRLFVGAVDPYNFYWLNGSKLNRWTGTIEEMEVPKWQLMAMAKQGAFDPEIIKKIGPMQLQEYQKQSWLRWGELPRTAAGPTSDTGVVKLTEFYGPLVVDGEIVEEHAHIIIANDTWILKNGVNDRWDKKPPYIAYSPLNLPFRTEGVGLVEMVKEIDKGLNQIVNLGVDTLLFRLLPIFEFTPDVYENPEDFRTGLTPGKMFRRNSLAAGQDLGIKPVQFSDVGPGAVQISGVLDRAHQEGGLVSELQQSLPRWSGAQTATETQAIQNNQQSFFGAMAADIENNFIAPLVEMAMETIMQYIDTANDPRIAAILGVDQQVLAGMSHAEIYEMIAGDYNVTVRGLSGALEKSEMLQNLVQLMNLIGQNPDAWLPYINQDALLRRILESFRPAIHDIEQIIADPQTVMANKQQMEAQKQQMEMVKMLPQLANLAHQRDKDIADSQSKAVDQAIQMRGQDHEAIATQQSHDLEQQKFRAALPPIKP